LASRSCDNWLDGLLTLTSLPLPAKKAIAVAAEMSVPAIAKRTDEAKRFRLNECGVFILIRGGLVERVGSSDCQTKCKNVKVFNLTFL
jgi:hypothetical protein